MKSAATPSTVTNDTPRNAVLCSANQTFEVRQVQSSNTLYILETPQSDAVVEYSAPLEPEVSAIGQCKALLELVPVATEPIAFLKQALPTYRGHETNWNLANSSTGANRASILADAPFSTGEFNNAWIDVCAFEYQNEALLPAAVDLCHIWKSFMSAAIIKGIDITKGFRIESFRYLTVEDGYPEQLVAAVLKRFSQGDSPENCKCHHLSDQTTISHFLKGLIDRRKCVQWVGQVILEARSDVAEIPISDILQEWQDQLPEAWREHAKLELLNVCPFPRSRATS